MIFSRQLFGIVAERISGIFFDDFLMRDFEPGLSVVWDNDRVIAMIF